MLKPGLYDQLITEALLGQLDDSAVTQSVDHAETPSRYAAHVHRVLAKELPGDFAISPELFCWESQNQTAISSAAGHRYLNQRTNGVRILLAVREEKLDPWGATMPYVLHGPADFVSHKGERPIAITWRLRRPIPAEVVERFKVAAA